MSAKGYTLLDSGNGRKLERIGKHILNRQAPQAFWDPSLSEARWAEAVGTHVRRKTGGGYWTWAAEKPKQWVVEHGGQSFIARPTPFGHLGLFAEQAAQWEWIRETIHRESTPSMKILNLFAYTGGSTLAAAEAGADVTHVDAARGVVDWARENQNLNNLEGRAIRWIVDDCQGFCDREVRRERHYDGIILDPPSFGRGKKGEVWKIEDHIGRLLSTCAKLTGPSPAMMLISAHTPGFGGLSLQRLVQAHFDVSNQETEQGEMFVAEECGIPLPSGAFARWRNPL